MINNARFKATNSTILELAKKKKKNQRQTTSSLQILQGIDNHFSSSSSKKPFQIHSSELKIYQEKLPQVTHSCSKNSSSSCCWYPQSSPSTQISWNTNLLLHSLAQRQNVIEFIDNDENTNHSYLASAASTLQTELILSKLFQNITTTSPQQSREDLLNWLRFGLSGMSNIDFDTTTGHNEKKKHQSSLVRKMCLPLEIHSAFSELLKIVTIEVLEQNNIRHWAIGGTLLGAMRHNGCFIPYDDDVDLVVAPNEGESEGEFDLRLRRALKLDAESILLCHQNENDASSWFAEASPLFGYKVLAGPKFYDDAFGSFVKKKGFFIEEIIKKAPFGIFVDLFVLKDNPKKDDYLEYAYEGARNTWPKEEWKKFNREPKRMEKILKNSGDELEKRRRSFPSCLHLPPTIEEAHEHLNSAFGKEWNEVCIVPGSSHGKTLPGGSSLKFTMMEFHEWGLF